MLDFAEKEVGTMNVLLRPWQPEDAKELAAALNNPNILRNLRDGLPYPYTQADAEAYITAMLSAEPGSQYAFAITTNHQVIGSIGVFRQQNIHRYTAELGYYISEPFWGKGITTSAVCQICRLVFTNSDIIRIFAEPFAYNTASCRVLEKSGFSSEGTMRHNAVKNGTVLDMKLYAVLKEHFLNGECS